MTEDETKFLESLALTDEKIESDWEAAVRLMADRGQDVEAMLRNAAVVLEAWRDSPFLFGEPVWFDDSETPRPVGAE